MDDILYALFSGEYDITLKQDKKQQELRKRLLAEMDKVGAAFGDEFLDRLCDLGAERDDWRNFQYYRAGFCLGARLILEALEVRSG